MQGKVHHDSKEHMGYDVQADLPCEMRSIFLWGGVQYVQGGLSYWHMHNDNKIKWYAQRQKKGIPSQEKAHP